jgi:hypothetical protein
MTESALAPARPRGEPMCRHCDELQKKIDQYRRFLAQNFDPLTQERIRAGISELEKRKSELH